VDKRRFTRIKGAGFVTLRCGSIDATGELEDISLKGMLVRTHCLFPLKQKLEVVLQLRDMPRGTGIGVKGTVVRTWPNGVIAVAFEGMDNLSFGRLRHWIEKNYPNPERLEEELTTYMDSLAEGAPAQ
jgi:hypothetical protein